MDMFDDGERPTCLPGDGEDEAAADRKLAEIRQGLVDGKEVFFTLPMERQIAVTVGEAQSTCGGSGYFITCIMEGLVKLAQEAVYADRIFTDEDGARKLFRETFRFVFLKNRFEQQE